MEKWITTGQAERINRLADRVLKLGEGLNDAIDLLNHASYESPEPNLLSARTGCEEVARELAAIIEAIDPAKLLVPDEKPLRRRRAVRPGPGEDEPIDVGPVWSLPRFMPD